METKSGGKPGRGTPVAHAKPSSNGRSRRNGAGPALVFGDLWPYEPAPESAEAGIKSRYDLFINGRFVPAKSGKYFDSINPAAEAKVSQIALAGAEDVDAAYSAARAAF